MTSRPASTGSATPVIQRASSLARKTAAQATSHPVPSVPSGAASRRRWRSASSMRGATIGPYTSPGTMQLTRMPCRPWSPAIERVMPTTAALEVEYGVLWLARRPAIEEMLMIEPPPPRIMWGTAYLPRQHDALDVDGHYAIPLLFGDFQHVGAHRYADVVIEDVEPAIALDRSLHHRLAVGRLRHVGTQRRGGAAFLENGVDRLARPVFHGIGAQHFRAFARKQDRGCLAVAENFPARAGPRDNRHLAREPSCHGSLSLWVTLCDLVVYLMSGFLFRHYPARTGTSTDDGLLHVIERRGLGICNLRIGVMTNAARERPVQASDVGYAVTRERQARVRGGQASPFLNSGYWILMLPAVSVAIGNGVLPRMSWRPCVVAVMLNGTPVRGAAPLPMSMAQSPLKTALPSGLREPLVARPTTLMFCG